MRSKDRLGCRCRELIVYRRDCSERAEAEKLSGDNENVEMVLMQSRRNPGDLRPYLIKANDVTELSITFISAPRRLSVDCIFDPGARSR